MDRTITANHGGFRSTKRGVVLEGWGNAGDFKPAIPCKRHKGCGSGAAKGGVAPSRPLEEWLSASIPAAAAAAPAGGRGRRTIGGRGSRRSGGKRLRGGGWTRLLTKDCGDARWALQPQHRNPWGATGSY